MATPTRNIRVPDDTWAEAKAILAERGTDVSTYLRGKLDQLVEDDRAHQAWAHGLGAAGEESHP